MDRENAPGGCEHGRSNLEERQVLVATWIYALVLHTCHFGLRGPRLLHFSSMLF